MGVGGDTQMKRNAGDKRRPEAAAIVHKRNACNQLELLFFSRPVASFRPDSSSPPAESCYPHKTPLFWKTPSAGCRLSYPRRIVYKYPNAADMDEGKGAPPGRCLAVLLVALLRLPRC